ncbi:hypothetical protein I2F30_12660, partial [Acinetobacter sp. SCC474]
YGGGLIETYYGTNSFEDFKDYYLDPDEASVRLNNEQITPPGSTYFSYAPFGEVVAINNTKGHLGDFYGADGIDNIDYGNINSVLFHYFITGRRRYNFFSEEKDLLLKEGTSEYKIKYHSYKIEDIYVSGLDFYYVDGDLISLTQYTHTKYSGGILNLI